MVTASGGAWNASIIAEYFRLKNQTLQTTGLGAVISAATDSGQFQILLMATIVMATDGGDDQSAGVAAALSTGRDAIQAGSNG